MSQPNNSATGLRGDDEYEFPDELEGIDWSTVGSIEGDEPKTEEQTQSSAPDDPPPPTELPPRPGSSSSSYGFADIETLDEYDLAELDETERLYGLATGEQTKPTCRPYVHGDRLVEEILENTPSSSARTLDTIPRPLARLPTADDIAVLSNQSSASHKRKPSGEDIKPPLVKKSRTLPLERVKPSPKGKETARDTPVEDVVQTVYNSFVESCSCPM